MAGLAFPIPSHLPRKQDVSSKILNKIDSATYRTLDSTLTSSWLNELNETIHSTRKRLHDRIQSDLPVFQRQLESAKSIQTRLYLLSKNVEDLNSSVSGPNTGIVPILLQRLTEHSKLVQEAADAQVYYDTLLHLSRCKAEFVGLNTLLQGGHLPEANIVVGRIDAFLDSAPEPLRQSNIYSELKRKCQGTKALIQEQLSHALTRCIIIAPLKITVHSITEVRGSDNMLSPSAVLASLTPSSLEQHLTTLRRDLMAHFIEYVLKQPSSVSLDAVGDVGHSLSLIPAPPNEAHQIEAIDNLMRILTFISTYLFPFLPSPQLNSFPQSLFRPVTSSLLNMLLIPSLPSSFDLLPSFLELAFKAVDFEKKASELLEGGSNVEHPIKSWVDGVAGHYERQRRLEVLGNCRIMILQPEGVKDRFQFEFEVSTDLGKPAVVPIQADEAEGVDEDAWGFGQEDAKEKTRTVETESDLSAWGFDEEESEERKPASAPVPTSPNGTNDAWEADADKAWGFDDDDSKAWGFEDDNAANVPVPETNSEEPAENWIEGSSTAEQMEPDVADAWGWDDDDTKDDPWLEPTTKPMPKQAAPNLPAPKPAAGLEKRANKLKSNPNGQATSIGASDATSSNPASSNGITVHHKTSSISKSKPRPTVLNTTAILKESFTVSDKAKYIMETVENLIDECKQLQASNLFTSLLCSKQPGSILSQTAASLVDLYIALYPVKFHDDLVHSPQFGMVFSNSCLYVSHKVEEVEKRLSSSKGSSNFEGLTGRLIECVKNLRILGDSWFEQVVENQCGRVIGSLEQGAGGFEDTGDQDRYDECEMSVNQVLQDVKRFAQQIKGVLTRGKYYTAIGLVAETALSRIIGDILALSDIPEVDSHQLSELCRILNSLEGLFSEDPTQPSFVAAYVPSWLKYNYLSELLEASMADISFLFDEGALVDFEIDELVRLVRALFADTSLRTNTINKLLAGHPTSPASQ